MFFYHPKKLINLIKSASSTAAEIKEYEKKTSDWYMGEEGKAEYQKATTLAAKVKFFQSYLHTVKIGKYGTEIIALAAYVLACAVDGTSLPFASFPEILDSKKNPIVKTITAREWLGGNRSECGIQILKELLGDSSSKTEDWSDPQKRPFEKIQGCSEASAPDMYKLQQCIIGVFCSVEDKPFAPYIYEIRKSATREFVEGKIKESN